MHGNDLWVILDLPASTLRPGRISDEGLFVFYFGTDMERY
jgi:hypothetical protein